MSISSLKSKRIVVLMGGASSEREISLQSGQAVYAALLAEGWDVQALDLPYDTKQWFALIQQAQADIAFVALHGTYGEDGCVQGLLECLNLPYTGSSWSVSALCMNKRLTKQVLKSANIVTPEDVLLKDGEPSVYPVFVKPVSEGSSVGLHVVRQQADWAGLKIQDDAAWLIEAQVQGVELAVSVLNGVALPAVEVHPKSGMYDYAAKYTQGATDYYCPARLPEQRLRECMQIAEKTVAILGCLGAPRVDFIVPEHGSPVVLEVNTIPGMTSTSLLPKAAAENGIDFAMLCCMIVQHASQSLQAHIGGQKCVF